MIYFLLLVKADANNLVGTETIPIPINNISEENRITIIVSVYDKNNFSFGLTWGNVSIENDKTENIMSVCIK